MDMHNLPAPIRREVSKLPAVTQDVIKQRLREPPPLPVAYQEAVQALRACQTLEEAKHWNSKADALAAYARVMRDTRAKTEAARLKLHACRRMYELAQEMRPTKRKGSWGQSPGAASLLEEHGLSKRQRLTVTQIGRLTSKDFDAAVAQAEAPTKAAFRGRGLGQHGRAVSSDTYAKMFGPGNYGMNLSSTRSYLRRFDPIETAATLRSDETAKARVIIVEIQEWLDTFEQYLPKA